MFSPNSSTLAAHVGQRKTMAILGKTYYAFGMRKVVNSVVSSCPFCTILLPRGRRGFSVRLHFRYVLDVQRGDAALHPRNAASSLRIPVARGFGQRNLHIELSVSGFPQRMRRLPHPWARLRQPLPVQSRKSDWNHFSPHHEVSYRTPFHSVLALIRRSYSHVQFLSQRRSSTWVRAEGSTLRSRACLLSPDGGR